MGTAWEAQAAQRKKGPSLSGGKDEAQQSLMHPGLQAAGSFDPEPTAYPHSALEANCNKIPFPHLCIESSSFEEVSEPGKALKLKV